MIPDTYALGTGKDMAVLRICFKKPRYNYPYNSNCHCTKKNMKFSITDFLIFVQYLAVPIN